MENNRLSISSRLGAVGKALFWAVLVFVLVQQGFSSYWTDSARANILSRFQNERKSRVIALIHRQETVSFFGRPGQQLHRHRGF
jgi:hypothetical protein